MFWSPRGGGVRRYLLTKQAWLEKRPGWRHTLAVPQVEGETRGVTLPSLPLPGGAGYRLPLRRAAMARVLTSLQPDVIEAGDPYRVAWAARDAAQSLGIPVVAYCHSNIAAMARLAGGDAFGRAAERWARRYARHVYAGFDLVLAPSACMARHLESWGVDRVACQPLGVDVSVFRPSRRDPAWRARHGIAPEARVLVYAGRFAPEKNLGVLADAVRRLGPPYVLVAIGAGPAPPPVSAGVRVLAFEPGAEALAAALASADVFVHAGDQETFGLSVLEALACGTPAVVRAAEGLAEIVDAGSGIGVAAGDGAAFADAVSALFERDPAVMGAAARERAEASDWERVLPELLGRYQGLMGRAAGREASATSRAAPVLHIHPVGEERR